MNDVISVGDQLASMIEPLKKALADGEANLEEILEAAEKQRKENTKMRRALAVVAPDEVPKRKTTSAKSRVGQRRKDGTATGFGISMEATRRYKDAILEIDAEGGTITQTDVFRRLGADPSQTSAAFKFLREIGFLGKLGRDKATKRDKYRIHDAQAYDRLAQEETNAA